MKRLASLGLLAVLALTSTASTPDVVGGSAVQTMSLTSDEARLIFTMRQQRWADGKPIRVVIYEPTSALQVEFLYRVLGMSPLAYEAQLSRGEYLGRAQPPLRAATEKEVVQELERSPYAIGYVRDAMLYSSGTGIVVIRILP